MSHELFYDADNQCVVLRTYSTVSIEWVRNMAPQVAKLCKEYDCHHLLNDMSKAHIELSLLELFESPQIMKECHIEHSIKRALVVPVSFSESSFLENVTQNRGHRFKVFQSEERARQWLRQT